MGTSGSKTVPTDPETGTGNIRKTVAVGNDVAERFSGKWIQTRAENMDAVGIIKFALLLMRYL